VKDDNDNSAVRLLLRLEPLGADPREPRSGRVYGNASKRGTAVTWNAD
jgi:hypothetical protein